MIPSAFIGMEVSFEYISEYINIIHPKDNRNCEDKDDIFEAYSEFFTDLGLTFNKDIFIIPNKFLHDCSMQLNPEKYLIGSHLMQFSPSWSIRRMQLEVYNVLTGMDFLVEEPQDIVKFYLFNVEDI